MKVKVITSTSMGIDKEVYFDLKEDEQPEEGKEVSISYNNGLEGAVAIKVNEFDVVIRTRQGIQRTIAKECVMKSQRLVEKERKEKKANIKKEKDLLKSIINEEKERRRADRKRRSRAANRKRLHRGSNGATNNKGNKGARNKSKV